MASLKANIAQESAVSTLHGPVIIVSCPGSGKTTTLVRRINRMIEAGIDPKNILMVTFTAVRCCPGCRVPDDPRALQEHPGDGRRNRKEKPP